jgi:hypothetical protein
MVLPVLILAYPLFLSGHQSDVSVAAQEGGSLPELQLGRDYFYLLAGIVIWPVVAAGLARVLGVAQNYVPYMIIYNWMAVPMLALTVISQLLPLFLASVALFFTLYVSWYVAKAGLRASVPVALAFLLADLAVTFGLSALMR